MKLKGSCRTWMHEAEVHFPIGFVMIAGNKQTFIILTHFVQQHHLHKYKHHDYRFWSMNPSGRSKKRMWGYKRTTPRLHNLHCNHALPTYVICVCVTITSTTGVTYILIILYVLRILVIKHRLKTIKSFRMHRGVYWCVLYRRTTILILLAFVNQRDYLKHLTKHPFRKTKDWLWFWL